MKETYNRSDNIPLNVARCNKCTKLNVVTDTIHFQCDYCRASQI